jgi:gliding motility-associated protein GldE
LEPLPAFIFADLIAGNLDVFTFFAAALLLLLFILSALVSGSEVAFFSLSQTDLQKASESKKSRHNLVVDLLKRPQKLLATILIANNFINILIVLLFAFIGEYVFDNLRPAVLRFLVEVVLITFSILLFGEVLPKVYASRKPLQFAAFMALPFRFVSTALTPVSLPLMGLTDLIEKKWGKRQSTLSVEKLSQALAITSDEATTRDEQKILEGIVSFGNTETAQIMTPRIDIFGISIEESFENVVSNIVEKGFSRNPVYDDTIDNIKGVLYAKDLLPHLHKEDFYWRKLIRTPYFVPENKKLDDLLKEFQEKKNHLAVVVDEYGGTSGIITLEDVIEEIVGDISDEFDDDELYYSKLDANNYLFEGKTSLKDFYKVLDIVDTSPFEEMKGESETIAGFVLEISGRFPKKNESLAFEQYSFKVEAMDKKRIKQLKVTIKRPTA